MGAGGRLRGPDRHHLPPPHQPADGARRVRPPRGAQRIPSAHRRRALPRARPRPDELRRRRGAADRQRPVAQGRRLGVLLRRRPAHPRPLRLPVRRRRDRRDRRSGAGRPAAHPRGAAPHPVHAQAGDLSRQRLGRRRRALAARRLRPDARLPRARPVQADRRRRGQLRRRLRIGVSGPTDRAEVRPRDLLPGPALHRRADARDGRSQRGRRPCRAGKRCAAMGFGDQRQIAAGHPDVEVRVQSARRRAGGPAAVRGRGDAAGVHDRRGRRGPRRLPGEARPRLDAVPRYF